MGAWVLYWSMSTTCAIRQAVWVPLTAVKGTMMVQILGLGCERMLYQWMFSPPQWPWWLVSLTFAPIELSWVDVSWVSCHNLCRSDKTGSQTSEHGGNSKPEWRAICTATTDALLPWERSCGLLCSTRWKHPGQTAGVEVFGRFYPAVCCNLLSTMKTQDMLNNHFWYFLDKCSERCFHVCRGDNEEASKIKGVA